MKPAAKFAAIVLAIPIAACAAPADSKPLPLWEAGVLGGVASTPAYPGSADRSSRGLLLPFLIYRGKVFRADQSGIGARLVKREAVELDVGLAASLPARSDDVAARSGMPNLGTLLEFGPRLKVRIAEPSASSRIRLDIPLRAVIEARAGVRTQGFTFEPKVVVEMRSADGLWTFDANAGVVIGDKKVNRYFYEVQPQYATATRPGYQADAGLMLTRVGASASRMINEDVRVFGFVRLESYAGAANEDSPLMKKKSGASAGVAFAWTLGRSTRFAGD
ncbi:MipA/OmpV family protein [Massilia aquatica]|uniref:MipA/OmpV family protein n=1 Tax=Massilia aquatica TaxID=2609000 RepID=A0ABX0LYA1_9BURK|nr:MipA/OmpV family protein [Massilia aquatica]NHZ39845.1 MipA/OmpV family protein [Massilia aquatica]